MTAEQTAHQRKGKGERGFV